MTKKQLLQASLAQDSRLPPSDPLLPLSVPILQGYGNSLAAEGADLV
jgi:hypothetical protein